MQVQNLWKISIQPFFFLYFSLFCSTQIGFISVLTISLYTLFSQPFYVLEFCLEPLDTWFWSPSSIWFEFPIHNKLLDWTCEQLGPTQFFCSRHTDQINDVNTTSFFNLDIEQFHLILVVLWVFFSAHCWTLIPAPIGSLTTVSYTQAAEDKPVGPSLHQYLFFANLSEALGAKWRVAKVENVPLTLSSQTWWGGTSRRGCDALLSVTHNEDI